jgi:hypothetical protein
MCLITHSRIGVGSRQCFDLNQAVHPKVCAVKDKRPRSDAVRDPTINTKRRATRFTCIRDPPRLVGCGLYLATPRIHWSLEGLRLWSSPMEAFLLIYAALLFPASSPISNNPSVCRRYWIQKERVICFYNSKLLPSVPGP